MPQADEIADANKNTSGRRSVAPVSVEKNRQSELPKTLTKNALGANIIADPVKNNTISQSRSSANLNPSLSMAKSGSQSNIASIPTRPSLLKADSKERNSLAISQNIDSKPSIKITNSNSTSASTPKEEKILGLNEIRDSTDFNTGITSIEKMNFDRKDILNKQKLAEVFENLATKVA